MRILMFGWDFPPVRNGGLGVACHGLAHALIKEGVEVVFVLPRKQEISSELKFIFAGVESGALRPVDSPLLPYRSSNTYFLLSEENSTRLYAHSLIDEVYRYAEKAADIASRETFDLIHAHDWTSYLAGLAARQVSGKPLILHVHATAFDQAGGPHVDPAIYAIEKRAFEKADAIVTVSDYTARILVERYGADPLKITTIHNGIDAFAFESLPQMLEALKRRGKKIVFYHGRITIQKGPDYFIRAAKRVLEYNPNVVFVVSGWGDMQTQIVRLAAELGIAEQVTFAGSLWDSERDRMYQAADLVVMPSVSEPFGLIPLEALLQNTPVLISKQSGVSEVLRHVLKVDFWDIDEMANKILAVLADEPLSEQLRTYGRNETLALTWKKAARKCVDLYNKLIRVMQRT